MKALLTLGFMSTLTIRNLEETVKQKLRLRAARHQRSMEAEVREIIRLAVEDTAISPPQTQEELQVRLMQIRGLWKDRGNTDELMRLTRGEV